MDANDEQQALEKADLDIETARKRIARQEEIISELERDKHGTSDAIALLRVLHDTLGAMLGYRASIVKQIERLRQVSKQDRVE